MMASAVRKTFSDAGTRLPSSDSTPSAKAMSVAVGIAQPRSACGIAGVDRDIDQRRNHHAAGGGDARQDAARPGRQLAVQHLALDLEADQQEEHRHQPVIDPVRDAERAEIGVQSGEIGVRQRRIGDDQRQQPPPPSG